MRFDVAGGSHITIKKQIIQVITVCKREEPIADVSQSHSSCVSSGGAPTPLAHRCSKFHTYIKCEVKT